MEIQNLKAFLEVADCGSFSVAGQRLHLTQPAVSKRIAQLEDELDAPLFDRIGRHVSLTEAGRALLPHAKSVQLELQAAERSVRDLAGEVSGQLRLATSHHIGLHRLPPVLSRFSADYPAVHIDIDFMDSEQAYDLTLKGDSELAVVTLAPDPVGNIISRVVWPDPLDFMVQTGHELTRRKQLDLATLAEFPAILPGMNTYTGQIVKRLFDSRKLPLEVSIATNYLETIRMMAAVGLGWTVLPRTMLDDSLAALPMKDAIVGRDLGVIHHEGRRLSRAAQAFIQTLLSFGDPARSAGGDSRETTGETQQ